MFLKNTLQDYGSLTKFFHWLIAILIISLLAIGLIMADMENSPDKFKLIGIHKEFGIIVLSLAIMRLGWKTLNISPMLPEGMAKVTIIAAKALHFMLYFLMFAMPITGWLMSSAAGFRVSMFGLFLMPNLIAPDKEFGHQMAQLHEILAYLLIGLILLHISAALLHHFYYKDNILKRMLPNFKGKNNAQNTDINTGC